MKIGKCLLSLLFVTVLTGTSFGQGALWIDVTWDKEDLPPQLQSASITAKTFVSEAGNVGNSDINTASGVVIVEKASAAHWIEDFQGPWNAHARIDFNRVRGYDNKYYIVWSFTRYARNNPNSVWQVEIHVGLRYYLDRNQHDMPAMAIDQFSSRTLLFRVLLYKREPQAVA